MAQLTERDLIFSAITLAVVDVALFLAWMNKDRDNLAGGIVGAAGTIFAGYVAWRAVQRQIEAEGRADALAELQMWERTRAELFTELHGLNSAKEAIGPMCEILNLARVRERQRQAPPRSEAWRGSDARSGLGFVRA